MQATAHIIGAGLAGLSAATQILAAGGKVALYEATSQAGGRCRSYHDAQLGRRIDNGNHLVLAANHATRDYLSRIGSLETMIQPAMPAVDFIDLGTGERWSVRPDLGLIPFWLFDKSRRVAGTKPWDYLSALHLMLPGSKPIAARMNTRSMLYRRLWQPLFVSVLNTPLDEADAAPMWRVLIEIFGRGGRAMSPMVPAIGLSESFIDPALAYLERQDAPVHFTHRLRNLVIDQGRVSALDFGERQVTLGLNDSVILAVPAQIAAEILPDSPAPKQFAAILNAHYRIDPPPGMTGILGVIGGTAEWIFPHAGLMSVTVSAADRLIDGDRETLARLLWRDVAAACGYDADVMPAWQIVKEKRATFRATRAELARRPAARTHIPNLTLAGDWTDTGLPATIEGAIRSGKVAATLVSAKNFR
jgi:squalene-associated FAD-dependent desaturase